MSNNNDDDDETSNTAPEAAPALAKEEEKKVVVKKSSNNKSTNNKNRNNKKRKRQQEQITPEDQLEQEQVERYEKLVYQAKRALHKECKIVKSFECQKVLRRIKECNDGNKKALEEKLALYKDCSIDSVVELGIRRLGLPNLNPKVADDEQEDMTTTTELMERILRHKRLVTAVDSWNDKVTEYRRWLLRRKDAVSNIPTFVSTSGLPTISKTRKKKMKKQMQKQREEKDDPTGGLFVSLGGDEEEEEEEQYHYGPGSGIVMEGFANNGKKKNRPGQQQRKAKALAIQAKKEGRTWDSSLNWRAKKVRHDDEEGGGEKKDYPSKDKSRDVKPKKMDSAKIADMGKVWKEEGKAHPSWAAKSSEKTGIVAFAGKKITFD